MAFSDRVEAGRRLATLLASGAGGNDPVVLGLPRGGVVVAAEVADALDAPLDVIVVRKLGVPAHPELAMGAVGEGGARVINWETVRLAGVSLDSLQAVEQRETGELERRVQRYRQGRDAIPLLGRDVVIVDDGVATGSTVRAACQVARARGARTVTVAAPVGPAAAPSELADVADHTVLAEAPEHLFAIGQWYDDFSATSDDEVVATLQKH
jgi:putative phosphoribosyl transferase